NEGATVVEIYNALGYAAAAVGNHEFDFGPAGELAVPAAEFDDPRGALKQRASEANFPLLAANLIDIATGAPVSWQNIQPSTMVDVAGVRIGIIGVVTKSALYTTIAANTVGLRIGSLTEAITREARTLRADGASLVIVVAHAGSRCSEFDDPRDLSSCDTSGEFSAEIMHVANALPTGLVDHIVGGHVHQGVAHIVNDIAVTSSYSSMRAFGRVDFTISRDDGRILQRKIFPPQQLCPAVNDAGNECVWLPAAAAAPALARYEGRTVEPDEKIVAIANRAVARAAEIKTQKLGVVLDTPFTLDGNPESPLANLFTNALYESIDADVVLHNAAGGLRAALPEGELTYGSVYSMFPFDNRVAVLELSGADLRRIIARQAHAGRRRAAFAGMRVFVDCTDGDMRVRMQLANGQEIRDTDVLRIGANDFLTSGGDDILTPAMPDGGFALDDDPRLIREIIVDWLRNRGGRLHPQQFQDQAGRRWNLPESLPATCTLQQTFSAR
ncbi:MAG: 5'-nucleotidase C-terminal domain-containing protein, partial [Gammaproteobacteria bacterium]|nr:5'-nucleotidase C-terminal domain-containing protein [Gammaproteobacteria bacterium]